ncbi:SseB family protein [Nocardioides aestuarii]|uniref:SseB family protein n=1 Tax=Nocardioides aestuarii TaxID=252231 RepID=A0ABW4TLR5_9ACTN
MTTDPERQIPDPGFAGDDGAPDPALRAALAAHASGEGTYAAALAVLLGSRVVVPVVAVAGEVEVDEAGLAHDKTSDMAAVLIARPDGRRGLLAFSGLDALAAWDPAARPVPVTSRTAARAAVQEGAVALLLDLKGPHRLVVEGEDLRALAAGWELASVEGRSAWIRPAGE